VNVLNKEGGEFRSFFKTVRVEEDELCEHFDVCVAFWDNVACDFCFSGGEDIHLHRRRFLALNMNERIYRVQERQEFGDRRMVDRIHFSNDLHENLGRKSFSEIRHFQNTIGESGIRRRDGLLQQLQILLDD
jgi:hypothetical protein